MKRPTKKIAHYSALAMGAVAILPIGCKKDTVVDDPNITVRTLSDITQLVGTGGVHHGIDIDGNGTKDTYTYVYDTSGFLESGFYDDGSTGSRVLTEPITNTLPGVTADFIKAIASGTSIGSSSTTWDSYGYTQGKFGAESVGNFAGLGDKYVGVKFYIGTAVHYAWILVNLSSDGKTFTVKKVGYNIVADAAINAGAE